MIGLRQIGQLTLRIATITLPMAMLAPSANNATAADAASWRKRVGRRAAIPIPPAATPKHRTRIISRPDDSSSAICCPSAALPVPSVQQKSDLLRLLRSTATSANRRHRALAALGLHDQARPLRERQTSLVEVVMSIVGSLDTLELVTEASFGNFPAYP